MRFVDQSYELLYPLTEYDWMNEFKLIERAGRTAYKSEEKITEDSHIAFIKSIVKRNHLAVVEFGSMAVHFTTDRGITHEIVRHRLCSFLQESTRYCNYGSDKFGGEITVIRPSTWDTWNSLKRQHWLDSMQKVETCYLRMLETDVYPSEALTPQQARAVLPNSLKTEIVVKANFREWRHIFQLRAVEKTAHPDMRALMIPLYEKVRAISPEIFDLGDPQ